MYNIILFEGKHHYPIYFNSNEDAINKFDEIYASRSEMYDRVLMKDDEGVIIKAIEPTDFGKKRIALFDTVAITYEA